MSAEELSSSAAAVSFLVGNLDGGSNSSNSALDVQVGRRHHSDVMGCSLDHLLWPDSHLHLPSISVPQELQTSLAVDVEQAAPVTAALIREALAGRVKPQTFAESVHRSLPGPGPMREEDVSKLLLEVGCESPKWPMHQLVDANISFSATLVGPGHENCHWHSSHAEPARMD